jgi:acetyl esterase/lipase
MQDRAAVAAWRHAVNDGWTAGDPPPLELGHQVEAVGGVRCLRTEQAGTIGTVVYLHGGGYALGSPEVAVPITARLAGDLELVSVDYRLAPEHPHPAAVSDGLAVYRALLAEQPERPIAVAGDSAGGGLALSVTLELRDGGEQLPAALALLSPHLDHGPGPRPAMLRRDEMRRGQASRELSEWLAFAYCGSMDRADPRLSPLRAEPGGLPPVLVQVGGAEALLSQSVRFARRARLAGVDVTLDVWDELWHTWHYHRLPEADRALAEVAHFLARQLSAA